MANCSFVQSFRALEPGNYVLRVTGGPIDEISAPFDYCQTPNLSNTILSDGNNTASTVGFMIYETPYRFNANLVYIDPFIPVNGAPNVHFFTVE